MNVLIKDTTMVGQRKAGDERRLAPELVNTSWGENSCTFQRIPQTRDAMMGGQRNTVAERRLATELVSTPRGARSGTPQRVQPKKKLVVGSKALAGVKGKGGPKLTFRNLMRGCCNTDDTVSLREKLIVKKKLSENDDDGSDECLLNSLPEDVWLECLARVPRSSLHRSMMVCQKWRQTLKSGEFYEVRRNTGRVENLLFVFGGAGTGLASAVYCKSSGGWKAGLLCTVRALEESDWLLDYHNADHCLLHAQPAVVNHRIFILGAIPSCSGGSRGKECTIIYDTWTKTLTRGKPMTHPRKKFASCVIDGRIYVAGGSSRDDFSREAIMGAEEYIPELDVWRSLPNMPRKRYGCLGAAVNGIFYVIGGLKFNSMRGLCMQPNPYVGSMDSFNTRTHSWQKTLRLPMRGCVIACTVVGSSIYMLFSLAVELSFWRYDTGHGGKAEGFYEIKPPPPILSPLRIDNYLKFACVTMGTSVYIIQVGGSIDDLLRRSGRCGRGFKEGLVLIYNTVTNIWSKGPDLPYVKNGATCAVVLC
jgi:hypothetical protein